MTPKMTDFAADNSVAFEWSVDRTSWSRRTVNLITCANELFHISKSITSNPQFHKLKLRSWFLMCYWAKTAGRESRWYIFDVYRSTQTRHDESSDRISVADLRSSICGQGMLPNLNFSLHRKQHRNHTCNYSSSYSKHNLYREKDTESKYTASQYVLRWQGTVDA